jgi:hypothetical protein
MTSQFGQRIFDAVDLELSKLQAIAEHMQLLADEATRVYGAALARAEGTPLLKPLEGQTDFEDDK